MPNYNLSKMKNEIDELQRIMLKLEKYRKHLKDNNIYINEAQNQIQLSIECRSDYIKTTITDRLNKVLENWDEYDGPLNTLDDIIETKYPSASYIRLYKFVNKNNKNTIISSYNLKTFNVFTINNGNISHMFNGLTLNVIENEYCK